MPDGGEWIGLTARRSRRGAARAVLIGRDSAGVRTLTTAATGAWRWAFRGGASREAYRALVAGAVDWLLGSRGAPVRQRLTADRTVPRGVPVVFRWWGDSVPDSVEVEFRHDGTAETRDLRFDTRGNAVVNLDTGVYRWSSRQTGASGVLVVEPYSDEFHPNAVVASPGGAGGGSMLAEAFMRQRWWLFLVAMAAFVAEWGWRQRRGLP